jgi:hypothetical protein
MVKTSHGDIVDTESPDGRTGEIRGVSGSQQKLWVERVKLLIREEINSPNR